MKKIYWFILFWGLFPKLLAQNSSIIPKFGFTYSKIALDTRTKRLDQFYEGLLDLQSKIGFMAGLGLNRELNENLSLQLEFLLIEKGFQGSLDFLGDKLSLRTRLYYFELPILAKYSFGTDDLQFYLNAGPALGYALGGKLSGEDTTVSVVFSETPQPKDYFFNNRLDLSLQGGLGLALAAGTGKLLIDARYGYSFSHLLNSPKGVNQSDYKNQNRVISLTFGYMIPLDNSRGKKRYRRR
jgi:opacity protein-like surface antigen